MIPKDPFFIHIHFHRAGKTVSTVCVLNVVENKVSVDTE